MGYKLFLLLSLLLLLFQLIYPSSVPMIAPVIVSVLLIRNSSALGRYMKFLMPSLIFILLIYSLSGNFRSGLMAVLILCGSSLSLQLYFSFFPNLSLYELLIRSGISKNFSFIIYASLNYAVLIKPLVIEIQDAQRIRGIEIPRGIRSLFHLPFILIPLMVKLLMGADHLAESLYLRSNITESDVTR